MRRSLITRINLYESVAGHCSGSRIFLSKRISFPINHPTELAENSFSRLSQN